jgi:O-antigen/teichoic acid export membrane protein
MADFGSSQAETRRLARNPDVGGFIAWLRRRTVLSLLIIPPTVAVLLATSEDRIATPTLAALSLQAVAFPAANGALAAVRALRSPAWAGWLTAAGNAVFAATCVFGVDAAAWGAVASWLVTASVAIVILPRTNSERSTRRIGNPWSDSSAFGVVGIAVGSLLLLTPIIGVIAGPEAAGNFAAVSRWVAPAALLPSAFSSLAFPRFARATTYKVASRMLLDGVPLLAVSAVALHLLAVFSEQLVSLVLGTEYVASASVLTSRLWRCRSTRWITGSSPWLRRSSSRSRRRVT